MESTAPPTKSLEIANSGAIAATFVIIFIAGVIGNCIVIYVIFRKRKTWNITTTYLFNLSVADAVFVCTLPLWAKAYLNDLEWTFGVFACKSVTVVTSLNMYASIFFLTAMSVDRWLAVVNATSRNTTRSSSVAKTMCGVVWGFAVIMTIPRLIFTAVRVEGTNYSATDTAESNVTLPFVRDPPILRCGLEFPMPNKRLFMGLSEFIQAIVGFIIPMCVICTCYVRIVRTVRKKLISKRVRKDRIAVLAAFVIAAFFVCWLPLQLMTLYSALAGWWRIFQFDRQFYWRLHPSFVCFAYANSCINPFIYAFTASNFKNNVKEVCGTNMAGCNGGKAYKMTIVKNGKRTPSTPDETCDQARRMLFISRVNTTIYLKDPDEPLDSSSEDIYEHFQPQGKTYPEGELGARGPPECQHLAVQDTTSGIYYEYFSSPAALCRTSETKDRTIYRRSDLVNHSDQPEISGICSREQSTRGDSD